MARKTNPAASIGCFLMIAGFIVLMAFDLIGGIIIFVVGAALGVLGALAGIICDIFGLGQDDSATRIIMMDEKKPEEKSERDENGYHRDVPAWLRDQKPKRPQPKKKPPGKKS